MTAATDPYSAEGICWSCQRDIADCSCHARPVGGLPAADLAAARQRLATAGQGRLSRHGHALGTAACVLERLLSGELDAASERGRAAIRSTLAVVAEVNHTPSHVDVLAARLAEVEDTVTFAEPHDPDRADRYRARAVSLRALLATAQERATETPADDSPAGAMLAGAEIAAGIVRKVGARIYGPSVTTYGSGSDRRFRANASGRREGLDGDVARLQNLRECVEILGLDVKTDQAGGNTHVVGRGCLEGMAVCIAAPIATCGPAYAAACAWLAELGVEVGAR